MKHVKMLGLLVMAAASLMAFAGSASAEVKNATLTSPAGTEFTGTIHATLEKGTSALLKAGVEDTCTESTAHGIVTTNNTTHAAGALTATGTPPTGLSFGNCTKHTTVILPGSLTIKDNGEVFAIGNEVKIVDTSLGVTCFYGGGASPGTKIGTLEAGTTAKLKVNTTELPKLPGSNFFCFSKGTWTANYIVTTPDTLLVT